MTMPRLLVVMQVAFLLALAWNADFLGSLAIRLVALGLGLMIGAAAVIAMKFRFSIFPVADTVGAVVDKGIYRWIRHPMYLSLLIMGMAVFPLDPVQKSLTFGLTLAGLAIVLAAKMQWEERALTAKFPGYAGYRQRTKRIIPFLW